MFDPNWGRIAVVNLFFYKYMNPLGSVNWVQLIEFNF